MPLARRLVYSLEPPFGSHFRQSLAPYLHTVKLEEVANRLQHLKQGIRQETFSPSASESEMPQHSVDVVSIDSNKAFSMDQQVADVRRRLGTNGHTSIPMHVLLELVRAVSTCWALWFSCVCLIVLLNGSWTLQRLQESPLFHALMITTACPPPASA